MFQKQIYPIQVEVVTFSKKIAKQVVIDRDLMPFDGPVTNIEGIGWVAKDAVEKDSWEMVLVRHEGELRFINCSRAHFEKVQGVKLDQIFLV